jgi:PAS domain S-box-containing protein
MLWLYLLGVVTFLGIVVRRLMRRQKPLNDELYSKRVAIDHVSSGVAWVSANGKLYSLNTSLSQMLGASQESLKGSDWMLLFAKGERDRVEHAYSQMLLAGLASLDTRLLDTYGGESDRELVLVAVHDHKMRFMGHHCIVERVISERGRSNAAAHASVESDAQTEFATLSS